MRLKGGWSGGKDGGDEPGVELARRVARDSKVLAA